MSSDLVMDLRGSSVHQGNKVRLANKTDASSQKWVLGRAFQASRIQQVNGNNNIISQLCTRYTVCSYILVIHALLNTDSIMLFIYVCVYIIIIYIYIKVGCTHK